MFLLLLCIFFGLWHLCVFSSVFRVLTQLCVSKVFFILSYPVEKCNHTKPKKHSEYRVFRICKQHVTSFPKNTGGSLGNRLFSVPERGQFLYAQLDGKGRTWYNRNRLNKSGGTMRMLSRQKAENGCFSAISCCTASGESPHHTEQKNTRIHTIIWKGTTT